MKRKYGVSTVILLLFCLLFVACDRVADTTDIPGDKKAFDPVKALPRVAAFAGEGVVLTYLRAFYIKPDGTLDFGASYKPMVEYMFIKKFDATKGAKEKSDAPLGAGNRDTAKAPEWESISVRIIQPFTQKVRTADDEGYNTFYHGGMEKSSKTYMTLSDMTEDYPVFQSAPDPVSFASIWEKAAAMEAPVDNAVAVITYYPKMGYTFEIEHTEYKFSFTIDGNPVDQLK